MAKDIRILLIRHGESMANVDKSLYARTADPLVPLSDLGKQQAIATGRHLADRIHKIYSDTCGNTKFKFLVSPYLRTRMTYEGIQEGIRQRITDMGHARDLNYMRISMEEDIHLVEQQFGLFDGIPDEELPDRYPNEHAHYKKLEDQNSRFYARFPMGESQFDVALRVYTLFDKIHREHRDKKISNWIIVAHGVANRAFAMQWLHQTPEWMEKQRNPENCSIRLIEDGKDFGYVFKPETSEAEPMPHENV